MLDATVVICAHNPRPDYLGRVFDSLRRQTLAHNRWELIVVDNASKVALSSNWDLSWHPFARHVREAELGLIWARRCGIEQAMADLILFVDDDNVLDEEYLAHCVKIHREWPSLGAWGSGSIRGDFEVEPQEDLQEIRPWLALRELTAPVWTNTVCCDKVIPWGAGLCVRREVAVAYGQSCDQPGVKIIGRQGGSLLSADDRELSLLSCSLGYGVGIFPTLRLTHLIPKHRVSRDYFICLVEGCYMSNFLLEYKWRNIVPQPTFSWKTMLTVLKTFVAYRGLRRQMRYAWVRALVKANRIVENHPRGANVPM